MAQRRMLAKSISTSRKVSQLDYFSALLYTWIIPHCDDFGRMDGDAALVKAIVFPLFTCTIEDVEKSLKELNRLKLVDFYDTDSGRFLEITNFRKFQTFKKDRPKKAIAPPPKKIPNGIQEIPDGTYKLSQVKLSQVKLTSAGAQVNNLISLFEPLNPTYEQIFKNRTQRGAMERLLEKFGAEKLAELVNSLPSLVSRPYYPRITTPLELEKNLGKLKLAWEQDKNKAVETKIRGLSIIT